MDDPNESEDAQAMRAAIAKQVAEGKLRTWYDPERRKLILFRAPVEGFELREPKGNHP
jgi:hypothetical protein